MRRLSEICEGARVLALGAHPDDVEIGAGGLVARLARGGAEVTVAVASVPTLPDTRRWEAAEGARLLGARLRLLTEEPSRVEDMPMHRLVARLDALIGELKPQLVITHSAVDLHWDHRLLHQATISSLRRTPCDLLAFLSSPEMNANVRAVGQCYADITDTMDVKLQAIAAHASQVGGPKYDLEAARDLARALGRLSGVKYAELYEVMRMTF